MGEVRGALRFAVVFAKLTAVKILGICGSLQTDSVNLRLLRSTANIIPAEASFEIYDGIASLPFFNPDIRAEETPVQVHKFRQALTVSDYVLIASPEYGHSLPGALKNALDWVISSGELYRKVVAVTASTQGPGRGERGLASLCAVLRAVDATIVGGHPIVRGPQAGAELAELMQALLFTKN